MVVQDVDTLKILINMIRVLLALGKISGVGDAFIKKNLSVFNLKTADEVIEQLSKITDKVSFETISEHLNWAENVVRRCNELNIKILPIYSLDYPKNLKELSNPPSVLYLLGNTSLLDRPIISLIGTRKSTILGSRIANRVGAYFSQEYSICNGLVDGIDRSSIENEDSVYPNVVGILSGGLNFKTTSSKTTLELAKKVLKQNGLLLSEVEPDQKEDQYSGSKSSRIQAGISSVLILIQSSIDGGSKYTIKSFSKLNRTIGYISFTGNYEYDSNSSFSANRMFDELGIDGVAKMCDLKKSNSLNIKKLVPIHSVTDYRAIIEELKTNYQSKFLF